MLLRDIFGQWLKDNGVDDGHIIYLSFDDMEIEELREPKEFLKMVRSRISDNKTHYLLLDEVQLMDRFVEVLISLMHNEVFDIFVTGSNSRFLSTDIVTEFRGRSQEIRMQPLTFSEYISTFDGDKDEAWSEYIEFGGLPQICLSRPNNKKSPTCQTLLKRYISRT